MNTTNVSNSAMGTGLTPLLITANANTDSKKPETNESKNIVSEKPVKETTAKKNAGKNKKNADKAKKTSPEKGTGTSKKTDTAKKESVKTSANPMIKAKKAAIQSLRSASAEQKTLSGAIKLITAYWKDGYKEAFLFLKLDYKDINLPKIKELWAKALINKDGVLMYRTKEAIVDLDTKTNEPKKDVDGKKIYILDSNGKKTYKKVIREHKNNFTPFKIFEALLEGAIERGEIVL